MEIKEMKPVVESFKIPRLDKTGKVVKNSADEIVYDEYIYDYSKLTVDRILMGRKLFHLSTKDFTNAPKDITELSILTNRETEKQAFSTILMKRNADGTLEKYEYGAVSSLNLLEKLTGSDFERLMKCQDDFFLRVGIQSPELMMQSIDILGQSVNILKGLKDLEKDSNLGMKETLEMILSKAATSSSELEKKST